MRIQHNIMALNAWRQLGQVNNNLSKNLERLSSGYRINRAADDPAGLVLSENLRAQIVGMDQALSNTQDGISMIQTAEGAMTEIHSLLDSMRSLALHAANTGVTTSEAVAADQQQMDSAIESINRIATTTAYAGKKLLDGSIGKKAEVKNTAVVANVDVGKANAPGISYVTVHVTTSATKAILGNGEVKFSSSGINLSSATDLSSGKSTTLNINGVGVTLTGGMTVSGVKDAINNALNANSEVGINAVITSGTTVKVSASGTISSTSGYLALQSKHYGSDYLIDLYDEKGVIIATSAETSTQHARGTNVEGYFEYKRIDTSGVEYTRVNATGQNGLTLVGDSDTVLNGLAITLVSAGTQTGVDVVRLYGDTTQFQIGANQGETYAFTIGNMTPSELGSDYTTVNSANQSGLNALKTGGDYELAKDPQKAIEVIDEAINDVSAERGKLGAIQANVLESNVRTLGVARENLQSSESQIRDVDMAKEMMEFTKNQILTQAATAMLAQANAVPQGVLTLLR